MLGSGILNLETLTCGEWNGFYSEYHRPARAWMQLYFEFQENQIRGEGTDYVGPWHAAGRYDLEMRTCSWTKQYIGQHEVHYSGEILDGEIRGKWSISRNTGKFHIWPISHSRTAEFYLKIERGEDGGQAR